MDFEEALRRYRPSGPPAELRARALGRDAVGRRLQGRRSGSWIYPFAGAAAAFVLYALTDSTHRHVLSVTSTADAERETAIAELALDLGGDETARLVAERLVTSIESAGVDSRDTAAVEEMSREFN